MRNPVQVISFSCFLFSVTFVQSQEVTCELKSNYGMKRIIPEGQNIFRAGESVEITCTETKWFFGTKDTTKSFTCKDNGKWDSEPICEEIRCETPHNQHVTNVRYYFWGDNKLGVQLDYYCNNGYRKMGIKATCTRDGWIPKPLCAEILCAAPDIQNAEIVRGQRANYKPGSRIQYECRAGFKPEEVKEITCNAQGQWTGIQQCTAVTCELKSNYGMKRIIPEGQNIFRAGESVEITCTETKWFFGTKDTTKSFTCKDNGKWDSEPICEEIRCETPHNQHVTNVRYYFWGDNKLGVQLDYYCDNGYRKMGIKATCTRDGWIPKPLCAEILCAAPDIQNAEIVRGQRANYKPGSRVEYKCHDGFEPEEVKEIICNAQGQWTGIQQCTDGTCQEQELKNIEILFGHPGITSPYKPGHILVFRCTDDTMSFYGQYAIKCQPDGRWNYPYPQCKGAIECPQLTKDLQFVTLSDLKSMYSNSEILRYTCNEPYNEIPAGALMCQNGKWNGTFDCKSKTCPPPPYLHHGDFSIISRTNDKVITAVSYTCQSYYVLNKQQESYKCVDGIWETPPKCLKPCEIDDIVEKYNLQLPREKVYIMHASKYRLNCKDGWNTGSEMKAHVDVSCSDGNLQIDKSCDIPSLF